VVEQPPVVLGRVVWRERGSSRGIQQVVGDLGPVQDARVDDFLKSFGVPNGCDTEKPYLALLPEFFNAGITSSST